MTEEVGDQLVQGRAFAEDKGHGVRAEAGGLKFPRGNVLSGMSLNILTTVPGVLETLRLALTGSIVLLTLIIAYKRILKMINS